MKKWSVAKRRGGMVMQASNKGAAAGCSCPGEAHDDPGSVALSRRRLLGATIAGATARALAGIGAGLVLPVAARAQTTMSPAEALQALVDGNRRFVERKLTFYQDDLA